MRSGKRYKEIERAPHRIIGIGSDDQIRKKRQSRQLCPGNTSVRARFLSPSTLSTGGYSTEAAGGSTRMQQSRHNLARHGRACHGHPRFLPGKKSWMTGTSPVMTESIFTGSVDAEPGVVGGGYSGRRPRRAGGLWPLNSFVPAGAPAPPRRRRPQQGGGLSAVPWAAPCVAGVSG